MKSVFYHKGIPYSFDKVRKQMHSNYARIMPAVAEIAVNFFQARFRAEAWTDRSAKRWAQRKNKDKNKNKRGILIKSGQLRNAIRPDLYPYLEYMPSTAGTPRSEHKKLYGVIKALDDPFWDTWLPPADWGCKCSVQQRRSDKGTNQPPEEIKLPPQAMRNNPGKDGQIFTNKHPMISRVGKKEAKEIDAWIDKNDIVLSSWNKFKAYGKEWALINFNPYNGGYNVYHQEHQFHKIGGISEKVVGNNLMNNHAKQVEFLSEKGKNLKKGDLNFDNHVWDVKSIENANVETIRSYIKNAARKADNVIFYYSKNNKLNDLRNATDRTVGFYIKNNKLNDMPDVFYMDDAGILKLVWKK